MKRLLALLLVGILAASGSGGAKAQPSLKDALKKRFLIGAAVNTAQCTGDDPRGASLVKTQFNSITPENALKWEAVHPEPGRYTFAAADAYVAFGEQHGMAVIGHTLVWHHQTPRWVFEDSAGHQVSREQLLERMHRHISSVVGRFKGRIKGWDVVNEAIQDDGSYTQSMWLKIIGEDYLVKAYQYAHEADPAAELYYNDFSAENPPKRSGVIRLVKMLQAAGVRVTSVGLQGHYHMVWPSAGLVDSTIHDFGALGVKVMITELDLDILPQPDRSTSAEISRTAAYRDSLNPYKNGLPEAKQRELADRYAELFRVFVKNAGTVTRVTFWGVEDETSWLNNFPVPGRTNYPLLFGRDGKPKPAFDAVVMTAR